MEAKYANSQMPYLKEFEGTRQHYAEVTRRVEESDALDIFDKTVMIDSMRDNEDFMPGGKYFETLAPAISSRTHELEDLFDAGVTIGADILQNNKGPRNQLTAYLNAAKSIDELKIGLMGRNDSTATTNGILEQMRIVLAEELPHTPVVEKVFDVMLESFEKASAAYPGDLTYKWFYTKLHSLKVVHHNIKSVRDFADAQHITHEALESTPGVVREQAQLLTKEAMSHRKYGTKPAYIESSFGGSWIYYDGQTLNDKIGVKSRRDNNSRRRFDNVAAAVFHSPHAKLNNLSMREDEYSDGLSSIVGFGGGITEAEPDMIFYIGKDGNISIDPDGLADIKIALKDQPAVESALRAELSANFYDLSMPVYRTDDPLENFGSLSAEERENFDPIQRLLIPRVRRIGKATSADSDLTDITRTVREHDVTWFVRTLPNGWRASPEAVAAAYERGIKLEENETFVKAHTRGTGNKVAGHHAIRRAGVVLG